MEQNTRYNREYIQRDHRRSEEKEEHSENRPRQANTTATPPEKVQDDNHPHHQLK